MTINKVYIESESYWKNLAVNRGNRLLQQIEALLLDHMPCHNLLYRLLICSTSEKKEKKEQRLIKAGHKVDIECKHNPKLY